MDHAHDTVLYTPQKLDLLLAFQRQGDSVESSAGSAAPDCSSALLQLPSSLQLVDATPNMAIIHCPPGFLSDTLTHLGCECLGAWQCVYRHEAVATQPDLPLPCYQL